MSKTKSYISSILTFLVLLMNVNLATAQNLGVIQPYLILGGTQGSMIEQFNEPDAVAFMKDGRLLAGDTQNGRFKIYTFSESEITITAIGEPGNEDCQFDNSFILELANGRKIYNEVGGIACDSDENIFVVDQGNQRILVFDNQGVCLKDKTIDVKPYLVSPDSASGTTFTSIQGLLIDKNNCLYLTDTGTRRIYKFSHDGVPDPKFQFQVMDEKGYILDEPESMAINGNNLYVADENHHTIKVYDKNTGTFTGKKIGSHEIFERQVEGLAIYQNYLFALNEEGGQVLIFDLKKSAVPLIGQFGEKGKAPGNFLTPDGMAVSEDGKYIVIADQGNFRLQIFLLQPIIDALN